MAGLSLAHRFVQLTRGDGHTAGGGPSATSLLECYKPMSVPDVEVDPLGPLDADSWEAWLRSNPDMYNFTRGGGVSLCKQSVSEAVGHNAFKPDEMTTIKVNLSCHASFALRSCAPAMPCDSVTEHLYKVICRLSRWKHRKMHLYSLTAGTPCSAAVLACLQQHL
jgi:hypothetical protein